MKMKITGWTGNWQSSREWGMAEVFTGHHECTGCCPATTELMTAVISLAGNPAEVFNGQHGWCFTVVSWTSRCTADPPHPADSPFIPAAVQACLSSSDLMVQTLFFLSMMIIFPSTSNPSPSGFILNTASKLENENKTYSYNTEEKMYFKISK